MDLDTENRLASLLLEEARRLQLEADEEGVHAYLRKPNIRHRPNSRFLTATVRGVQQANCVVEVDEMWRAREKELELESKLKRRYRDLSDSRGEKRKGDSSNQSSSSKIDGGMNYNSSYSDQEAGLGDDDVEKFLHSRSSKRGRGAIGSRMDEPGPYLKASVHCQDNESSADTRLEEKWERRVQGPERPLFLRSRSPDDCWHRQSLDREPSSSKPDREKKNRKEKKSERSRSPDDCWHRQSLDREPSSSKPDREKKNRKEKKSEKKERRGKIRKRKNPPGIGTTTFTKAEEGSDVP